MCRALRQRYPNARWIPLLAVGFSIGIFGVIARFVLPHADDASFTLSFIVPMGVGFGILPILAFPSVPRWTLGVGC
ncbi:MAG: hypothetical protein HY343_00510 [Lentisphaerae bacterium]|nr:hypothetical protein [Lentisphaerota bacterium]